MVSKSPSSIYKLLFVNSYDYLRILVSRQATNVISRNSFEPIVVHRMNNDLSDEAWEKGPTLTLAKCQRLGK